MTVVTVLHSPLSRCSSIVSSRTHLTALLAAPATACPSPSASTQLGPLMWPLMWHIIFPLFPAIYKCTCGPNKCATTNAAPAASQSLYLLFSHRSSLFSEYCQCRAWWRQALWFEPNITQCNPMDFCQHTMTTPHPVPQVLCSRTAWALIQALLPSGATLELDRLQRDSGATITTIHGGTRFSHGGANGVSGWVQSVRSLFHGASSTAATTGGAISRGHVAIGGGMGRRSPSGEVEYTPSGYCTTDRLSLGPSRTTTAHNMTGASIGVSGSAIVCVGGGGGGESPVPSSIPHVVPCHLGVSDDPFHRMTVSSVVSGIGGVGGGVYPSLVRYPGGGGGMGSPASGRQLLFLPRGGGTAPPPYQLPPGLAAQLSQCYPRQGDIPFRASSRNSPIQLLRSAVAAPSGGGIAAASTAAASQLYSQPSQQPPQRLASGEDYSDANTGK